MDIRRQTKARLDKHFEGMVRIGATGPGEGPAIEQALSGDLQNNANQTNIKRAIPEDYKYDAAALKPMAKMLWSMSVSLGHALSAHKAFVRLKSATISPDGMLGGRGYVMAVKDVRTMLHDACEALSALCDTIHDEINAPHWQPKLGQLERADVDRIRDLLSEAQGYLDDPEEMTKEDEEEVEGKDGHAGWHHPAVDKANKNKKEPRSDLPGGGDKETSPQAQPLRHDMRKSPNPQNEKTASLRTLTMAERVAAKFIQANSSLPVDTMPGGPRVDHLDRGDTDQTGPFGTYDHEHGQPDDEMELSDKWRRDDGFGNDYNYPSDWANDLHEKQAALGYFNYDTPSPGPLRYPPPGFGDAQAGWSNSWAPWTNPKSPTGTSAIPDSNSDKTPTEGFDFGIGDGNGDNAHGQGAGGYGEGNPGAPDTNPGGGTGNRGVYGPQSGIPKDPGGKVNPDESDSNLTIENEIGGKGRFAVEIGDPWAVKNNVPGTKPFGAPDFQEAVREEPPGAREAGLIDMMFDPAHDVFVAASPLEAIGLSKEGVEHPKEDKPWGQDAVGWVMGLDPETLIALGHHKEAWYDGVYDYEHPVEPVGQSQQQGNIVDPGNPFAAAPLPAGPQEPFIGMFMEPEEDFDSGANLPGDDNAGVARTDYYDGPKPINMDDVAPSTVGQTRLPGEQMPTPPKPVTQRPSHNQEHEFATMNPLATGELPGDGSTDNYDFNRDLGPDQTTTYEQDNTPYIKWDDNTHEMRPDPIQQRDPVQGPYVHNDLTERPSNG